MAQQYDDEAVRRERHRQRVQQMRADKRKQMRRRRLMKKLAPLAALFLAAVLLIFGAVRLIRHIAGAGQGSSSESIAETDGGSGALAEQDGSRLTGGTGADGGTSTAPGEVSADGVTPQESAAGADGMDAAGHNGTGEKSYQAQETSGTVLLGDTLSSGDVFYSQYAVLVDVEEGRILAERNARTRIVPASMTKILTVLVAAEHIDEADLDDPFTMTLEITDYAYVNDCSAAGFLDGEEITVRDLFYGTVLPSGADAAVGLAVYVAGSQEAFVELMNEKVEELGLSQTTHFTNCAGIYDDDHYTTPYDMAMIMEAAMDNEICREVMAAHRYTTSATEEHPEGIDLSNLFLRRIEDKEGGEKVLCAKTGYVVQSGHCAASYAVDADGRGYVCVTANANSKWRPVEDHAKLYRLYSGL
ncbi:MAG: D-alanyl-D-alanine carboxypeptidase [Lachnospiraceae bacterium]|nr:D-alanyl-D-alanine carboxypeptidase [Lachnospiraceae bacterium]